MNIWQLSHKELVALYHNARLPCPKQDIGDVTVVCHLSSQGHLLRGMIESARAVTDEIIVFDDCSIDDTRAIAFEEGCRVFNVPEGWIYTHGFGALIKRQVEACETQYHLGIDAGERLWIPPDCPDLMGEFGSNMRLNNEYKSLPEKYRQEMYYRIIKTDIDLVFTTTIHGSPTITAGGKVGRSQIVLFHEDPNVQDNIEAYIKRRSRLYLKMLQKGLRQNTLHNPYWERKYRDNAESYEQRIRDLENELGVLGETSEEIIEVKK